MMSCTIPSGFSSATPLVPVVSASLSTRILTLELLCVSMWREVPLSTSLKLSGNRYAQRKLATGELSS